MILIIPSIELSNGICCQKVEEIGNNQGIYQNLSEEPYKFIRLLRRENAKSVYLIDNDSFVNDNKYSNWSKINQIKLNTDIPIQLEYNFKEINDLKKAIEFGITRLIINYNFFLNNLSEINEFGVNYGFSSISIKIDYTNQLELQNMLSNIKYNLINRIVLSNYNFNDLDEISKTVLNHKINITLKDNINSSKELICLNKSNFPNIDSLILGNALYQNVFPCQKIWREVEQILEPNLINL